MIIDDHTKIQARSIVLAVGSTPDIPSIFSDLGDRVIINDDVFYWQDLPKSVGVFGPGVIGLELGQALHRLQVRTTIFGRGGRVGPITDPEIKDYSKKILNQELDLQYAASLQSMRRTDKGVDVEFLDNEGNLRKEHYEYLLVTTGRRPNFDKLQINKAGRNLIKRVFQFLIHRPCNAVNRTYSLLEMLMINYLCYEASDEGRIAGANAARFPEIQEGHRRSPLNVVFCDPQIAIAG